jgi:hypothetical protein
VPYVVNIYAKGALLMRSLAVTVFFLFLLLLISSFCYSQSFTNGSFETGSLAPWVTYGDACDVVAGPWYKDIMPYDGTYMAGLAAVPGNKNGGIYQRVAVTPGRYCYFRVATRTWHDSATGMFPAIHPGIDPTGQTDPSSPGVKWYGGIGGGWVSMADSYYNDTSSVVTFFVKMEQPVYDSMNIICVDGIEFVDVPNYTVQQAKALPDRTRVALRGCIVTVSNSSVPNAFYVQEPDRQSGIRVEKYDLSIGSGDVLDVVGTISTNMSGERIINPLSIFKISSGGPVPKPIGVRISDLGGAVMNEYTRGAGTGVGPNNIGLRVKTFGKIASISARTSTFWIKDANGRQLTVNCYNIYDYKVGDVVSVTGVVGLYGTSVNSTLQLYMRGPSDIVRY